LESLTYPHRNIAVDAPSLISLLNLTALVAIMLSMGLQVQWQAVMTSARPVLLVVRKALAVTTAARNAAVGLVIVTSNFAGTPAVTAVVAYALVSILGALGFAVLLGKVTAKDIFTARAA
jgi:hypothetical protein